MSVNITLDDDEALVLFELLGSKKLLTVVDVPERNVLWVLDSRLEEVLEAPFRSDYPKLLEAARDSLIKRYGS